MTIDSMTAALSGARLVQFGAVLVMLGSALFRLYAGKGLADNDAVRKVFDRWLRRVLIFSAAVSLVSSVAWVLVQAVTMADGWSSALSGGTLSAVLLQSEFGRLWIGRLALAGLLTIVVFALSARRSFGSGWLIVTGLSTLLVASLAGTGHAVMADGLRRFIDVGVHAVHLVAAAIWIGGLLPLGYILWKARRESDVAWSAAAQAVLPRYSKAGVLAVLSLAITGLLISWSLVGGVAALFSTMYGQLLLAKIGVFLLMVGLALFNRVNLTPKILTSGSLTIQTARPLTILWRNVALEQGLAIIILSMVSILGMLPPGGEIGNQESAKSYYSPAREGSPQGLGLDFGQRQRLDEGGHSL